MSFPTEISREPPGSPGSSAESVATGTLVDALAPTPGEKKKNFEPRTPEEKLRVQQSPWSCSASLRAASLPMGLSILSPLPLESADGLATVKADQDGDILLEVSDASVKPCREYEQSRNLAASYTRAWSAE